MKRAYDSGDSFATFNVSHSQMARSMKQMLDAVSPIACLLRKADEWHLPIWLASMDVRSAFDEMAPKRVVCNLLRRGASLGTACAFAREMVGGR